MKKLSVHTMRSQVLVCVAGSNDRPIDYLQSVVCICCLYIQGSHTSWKVLESPGFFFLKIPGPGKSWKITLVLESPGN